MRQNLSAGFAGVCGAAMLAGSTPAIAQSEDFQISAPVESHISDRWRLAPKAPVHPVLLDQRPLALGNYPATREPVLVLQKDFRLSHAETFSVRLESQKTNNNDLQDIIKSGTLPFMDRSEEGGGKMGLKFKKGVMFSYKREF